MRNQIINNDIAPVVGPYSQAIEVENMIFIAGQLGVDHTGELEEGIEAQTHRALKNAQCICKTASVSLKNAIKVTVLVSDLNNMPQVNEIYKEYFEVPYPSRVGYEVARLPKDALIEIDFIISK